MADTPLLTIVRAPAWQALVRRLDAAVAHDPRLAAARDVVLRPVELLRVMAADAPAALGDDVLRADRLRALLFLAWPYVAVAAEARAVLDSSSTGGNGEVALIARLVGRASTGRPPARTRPTTRRTAATTRPAAGGAASPAAASPTAATAAAVWPPEQPYEPGVIDHAALLVLMLAAARVADPPFAPVFVETVHGLAVAASAAEVLGRLDPRQPDASSLDVVLETLYVIESATDVARNKFLRPFVFDPVERGRWRCLEELAGGRLISLAIDMGRRWDGATSDEILAVDPKVADSGDVIVLTVQAAGPDEFSIRDPLRDATVVFASPDGPLLPTSAVLSTPTNSEGDTVTIDVDVPDGVSSGWIGFSRADMIRESRTARSELIRLLSVALREPCVDGVGRISPERLIPAYGELATPRRRGLNRFEGGAPVVVFAGVTPEVAHPGDPVTLRWETTGAERVIVELAGQQVTDRGEPTGSRAVTAPTADGEVELIVTPVAVRGESEVTGQPRSATLDLRAPVKLAGIDVTQNGRASPLRAGRALDVVVRLDAPRSVEHAVLLVDDPLAGPIEPSDSEPGRLAFQIASDHAHDGMRITVTVEDRTGGRDSRSLGPLALATIAPAQVVLVRPAILRRDVDDSRAVVPPVDRRTAHDVLQASAEAAGLALTVVDLPWADDDLAVLVERPSGDSDPALLRLLEALARRALLTPRFEGATWLALLPDDDGDDGDDGDDNGDNGDDGDGDDGGGIEIARDATPEDLPAIARSLPANAARAVAVATPGGLDRLLAAIYAPEARPAPLATSGARLAILGEIDDGDLSIADVRVDDRGEGPGAPVVTRLVAVTIDDRGRELDRAPIRVLTASRPALIATLVPISSSVGAVELRDDQGTVYKVIRRAAGALTLVVEPDEAPRNELHWTWSHTQNTRPRVSLLLRQGGLETPVFALDPCRTRAELPLWRFAFADGLALYATDGWNPAEQTVDDEPLVNDATVVLRRLSDGRFFADVPGGCDVTWLLNGAERARNARTFTLGASDSGVLEIVAQLGEDIIRDARDVPGDER